MATKMTREQRIDSLRRAALPGVEAQECSRLIGEALDGLNNQEAEELIGSVLRPRADRESEDGQTYSFLPFISMPVSLPGSEPGTSENWPAFVGNLIMWAVGLGLLLLYPLFGGCNPPGLK
jgi:hypothetical protein